jgi:hypothetical protein
MKPTGISVAVSSSFFSSFDPFFLRIKHPINNNNLHFIVGELPLLGKEAKKKAHTQNYIHTHNSKQQQQ